MEIWISTNIKAHNFISEQYWINNFDLVKEMIANSDVYIFEENNIIKGFIGIVDQNYIAGLFVRDIYQRDGVGKELLNYCKSKYSSLMLDVFIKNKNALSFYQKNNFKVIQKHFNEGLQEQEYTMYFGKR